MNWVKKYKLISVIIAFVLFAIIGAASDGHKPSTSKATLSDKNTSATSVTTSGRQATAKTAPAPQILLDLTGTGTSQTQQFTAVANWDLNWRYDCTSLGSQGNFQVMVYNKDGSLSYENTLVNQLGNSGTDVQHYYKAGTFYLNVNSECSWHVTAKG